MREGGGGLSSLKCYNKLEILLFLVDLFLFVKRGPTTQAKTTRRVIESLSRAMRIYSIDS